MSTQKQERVIKYLDAIKLEITHHLSVKSAKDGHTADKTHFVLEIEKLKAEARKGDSHLPAVQDKAKTIVRAALSHLPESSQDNVKSEMHKMNLAIHGRRA